MNRRSARCARARIQGVLDPGELGNVLNLSDPRVLQLGPVFDNGNG